MMSETRLLASTVSEYRTIFGPDRDEYTGSVNENPSPIVGMGNENPTPIAAEHIVK